MKSKIIEPFVGVTGFSKRDEVKEVAKAFVSDQGRKLMIGVLVCYETLKNNKTGHLPSRYPDRDTISSIFVKDERLINLAHYYPNKKKELYPQLAEVMDVCGDRVCDGIQINSSWPDPGEIEKFIHDYPDKKLVIQFDSDVLCQDSSTVAMHYVAKYEGLMDYIIFDNSGGRGSQLSSSFLMPFITKFAPLAFCVGPKLIVAGGLWSNNLRILKPLLDICPDLSFDAEGMLRDENGGLSIDKAKNYLRQTTILFG